MNEDGGAAAAPVNDPPSSSGGESGQSVAKAPSKLPKSLEGKSVDEIAEMYVNAEKKLGEQSTEVKEAREKKKQIDVLLLALHKNPDLYQKVDKAVRKLQGMDEESTSDGGEKDPSHPKTENDDVRSERQTSIIGEFEKNYGLNKIPKEQRDKLNAEIGNELCELFDPTGTKTVREVLLSIPVNKLSKYLDKAYKLARPKVFTDDEMFGEDDFSSIGGFSAGGSKSKSNHGLTPEELKTAEKLGVSPDKYAKQKQDRDK